MAFRGRVQVAVDVREHRVAPAGLGRRAPFAFQGEQNFQAMAEDDGLGEAMLDAGAEGAVLTFADIAALRAFAARYRY